MIDAPQFISLCIIFLFHLMNSRRKIWRIDGPFKENGAIIRERTHQAYVGTLQINHKSSARFAFRVIEFVVQIKILFLHIKVFF